MEKRFLAPVVLLGVLTLVLAATMPKVPAVQGVQSTILELEFARDTADVEKILGGREDIRTALIENIRADRFFLLAYSAYLILSCLLLWRRRQNLLLLYGVGLSIAAGVFDHFENGQLMGIVTNPPGAWTDFLPLLTVFTWLKWGALTAVFLLLGWFLQREGLPGKILFALAIAAAVILGASVFMPALVMPYFSLLTLLFVGLFIIQIRTGLRN